MFSIDRIVARNGAALIAAALIAGPAIAATVVVRAGGPSARSYPVGKALPAGAPITLRAGDTLTVLDSKGTRTLRGPGSFAAESTGAQRTNASFAALVSTKAKRRARTGAVRTGAPTPRASSLWAIDTARDGTVCVPAATPLTLWRADPSAAATATVRNDATGASAPATFAVATATAAWPAALPTTEGASYTLTAPGMTLRKVRFAALSADLTDAASTAAALYGKGCTAQYELLVSTIEDSGASASL